MSKTRIRIGDILGISTQKGIAYAQLTHRHPEFGDVIVVHAGLHEVPLQDPARAIDQPIQFVALFTVAASVRDGFMSVVGHAPVPSPRQRFPTFRTLGLTDQKSPEKEPWWLWDGEREWRIGELTREQRQLPLRMIPGEPLLLERIVNGWKPENDPR